MVKKLSHNRLPRNFHQSFKPERHYIAAMLRFAASGKEGNLQFIATETGIPTGTKSGKVPAILDYCRGMGLIQLTGEERSANKRPDLTSFGRAVFLEDPFLKTDITQWIAHLNLCSSQVGADIWYHTFFSGTPSLGFKFERSKLESYLGNYFGVGRTGLIGPMIGMYEDEAAFRICGALSEKSGIIIRKPAPIGEEYGYPYGAWILQLIFDNFSEGNQISITELEAKAGWRTIPGWNIGSHQRVLELVERKGLIEVDRHMEPWLLHPKCSTINAWKQIFDDML